MKNILFLHYLVCKYRAIGLMSRVFANGLGDQGSIPGQVIPNTQKKILDAALLSIKHYKVRIKVKVWVICRTDWAFFFILDSRKKNYDFKLAVLCLILDLLFKNII